MQKRGGLQLSVNFIVILILSIAILGFGIVFIARIHSSSRGITDQVDQRTRQELLRLRNEGKTVAFAPTIIREQGVVMLMITNDGSVDSSKFGFRVTFDVAFARDRSMIIIDPDIPDNWIARAGTESTAYEIKPRESKEFLIAVKPTGNPPSGTYIFNVDVRYDDDQDGSIAYHSDGISNEDPRYKSLVKFYVKV